MNQPSETFVRRTRNPDEASPRRFEPVPKAPGTYVLTSRGMVQVTCNKEG
jgi:hypothetical protein